MITKRGHRISSQPLHSDEPLDADLCKELGLPVEFVGRTAQFMAFSTRVDNKKTVLTAIGLGTADGRMSPIAHAAFKIVEKHLAPEAKIILCECRNKATAQRRALDALFAAPNGGAVLVLCKDSTVYDSVLMPTTFGLERQKPFDA